MEFRVLGALEVVRDGERVPLGAPQQRALLAVFLLHRGEAMPVDRLVDELWGDRAPVTATKTVQGYVSRLRKQLGSGVIVSEAGGYRLAVEPEQVDVGRFEVLMAEGRSALGHGDEVRASERLGSALGLWRGEPFADFTYEPFAQDAISGLREARLAALEDRIEADLMVGMDGQLIGELESLIASNPLRERLRGQLMLALYRAGRQADALAVYRRTSEQLREELGLEPSPSLRTLERSILEHDASLNGFHARAGSRGVCPFKGLAFFDRADAAYFFGRERLVSDLLARLAESPLVGILGPSGIGKSSLLRAGVLAALSDGALPGSDTWRQVLIRPGEYPRAELRRALAGDGLDQALARLSPGLRIVLGVDQFEELFTVCAVEEERDEFIQDLVAAARDPARRALIVIALRADFYGRLATYPDLAELLSASHSLVGPMDRDELGRAIERPAARAGLELEDGLAEALVADVAGEPGGLPLLSTALLELWRAREGPALRYDSYRTSGGVRGAVARLAEDAYLRLDHSERDVARGVMLRLAGGEPDAPARRRVPLGDLRHLGGADRVVAALTDARLLTVSDGEVELSHEAVLREWPRYRAWLEEDRAGRRLNAHLMSSAREWAATGRDSADLYRGPRLTAALEWAGQHRDELGSLEQRFLDASRRRAEQNTRRLRLILSGVVLLLVASVVAGAIALIQKQHATVEARAALARQLGAQAVNEPRLDLAMLLAREAVNLDRSPQTEGSLLATLQRSPRAIRALTLPINGPPRELAVSPDGTTLAVGGVNLNLLGNAGATVGALRFFNARTYESEGRELTDFAGAQAAVYSADGSMLAYPQQAGQEPDSIAVRDAHTLGLLDRLTLPPLQTATEMPDLPRADVLIAPDGAAVYCAYRVFSIAHGFGATYLARWSLPSGRLVWIKRIDGGPVLTVGLMDSGARVASVDARTITVFDARSLRRLSSVSITAATSNPSAAAVNPDGNTIAIASQAGSVWFVNASTGEARAAGGPNTGSAPAVAFAPDGRAVASTADNAVIVWDPLSATAIEKLTVPGGQVQGLAFSPDGRTLYTSSVGGLVLAWDLSGERSFGHRSALGTSQPCCDPVAPLAPPLAISPDGNSFAVRLGPTEVGLFSTRTLRRLASFTIKPAGARITALAWSPNSPQLAIGGHSGLVQLWRVDGTPRLVRRLNATLQPILGKPEAIQSIAFSPDGQLVAASNNSETVIDAAAAGNTPESPNDRLGSLVIWRASSGKVSAKIDLSTGSARADPLAFSRDGKLVAVAAPGGLDLIIDAATAKTLGAVQPSGGETTAALAFAPDGTLVTGSTSGTVQLWNPTSGAEVGGPLPVSAGPVSSIAFSPNGQLMVTTASDDGTVKVFAAATLQQQGVDLNTDPQSPSSATFARDANTLLVVDARGTGFAWPMSPTAWERRACAIAGRNLTPAEWDRYLPGQAYTRVCP